MGDAFAEFFKLVSELSWRRVFGLIFGLSLVVGILYLSERQASWIALSRLERSQKLVAEIATLEKSGTLNSETAELVQKIKRQLNAVLVGSEPVLASSQTSPNQPPPPPKNRLWSFIIAAAPWLLLAPLGLPAIRKAGGKAGAGLFVLTVFAAISGAIAAMLPDGESALVNYAIVPMLAFALSGGAIVAASTFETVSRLSRRKAVLNNLRQLSAALDQFNLETGNTTAKFDDLVGANCYINVLSSVAGEDYRYLRFDQSENAWTVAMRGGETVTLKR